MSHGHIVLPADRHGEWDRFVLEQPTGSVFQTSRWLAASGGEPEIHALQDGDGALVAGVALCGRRRYGVQGYHIPLLTPQNGPVLAPSRREQGGSRRTEEHGLLMELLQHLPRAAHYDFLLAPGHHDIMPYHLNGWSSSVAVTYRIPLQEEDPVAQMARSKSANLARLRRRVGEGSLAVDTGTELEPVLGLVERMARFNGYNPRIPVLRRQLLEGAPGRWRVIRIHDGAGELLGAMVLVFDNHCAFNIVNAVRRGLPNELKTCNLLLMDEGVRFARGLGLDFDFEGSMLRGVEEFYRTLGAVQVPVYRVMRSRSPLFYLLRSLRGFRSEWRGVGP